ncbi:sigma-70 family RNA polymerase sigma factor [Anaeromyxobacter paludicola]|uniref:Sigma-70 family RNA polymerase sigma factor n=1 Tax=Anaeromyxobacter paludicola TaxID=2918171 RepID=A0ABN6N8H4_9BACT|nr:sigma-70 family RNA polymerase sigma factor [Anaeromyxobacter paludicola]BDG09507.1 hypothetical protein AMPC_26200 [Anaeromyxobacter paludicola]
MARWRSEDEVAALGREALAHADALHDLAWHLTRDDEEAADLVQETFAHALQAARRFEPGNLRAWLFRILRNAFLSRRRRDRRSPIDASLDGDDAADRAAPVAGREGLEAEQLRRVVGDEIEAALASLSTEARWVVLLDQEGLTEAEMAATLECPAGTVKSRLARARAALRERLADYGAEGGLP